MEILDITRVFKYKSVTLPDPNPELGPDQVREFYSTQYAELLNSVVEGPVTKKGTATYTFARAVGDKGAGPALLPAAELIRQAFSSRTTAMTFESLFEHADSGRHAQAAKLIAEVAARTSSKSPSMTMPQQAFGLWG